MKVVSTFAGCGGSSLGYEAAGCEVVAAVEWESHAAECYRNNHPGTLMMEGDIGEITGAQIMNATGLQKGELDILDGSPPCQGFSTAGHRLEGDPRNTLVQQQLRLVDELHPKHVVIENVAGMIKGHMRPVAGAIVQSLKDRGYRVAAGLLTAQYFGVGQLRPRVFFIGSREVQPRLPRPTTRSTTAGDALRGVEPGDIPIMRAATARLCRDHLRPGETGDRMLIRLGHKFKRPDLIARGEKGNWFSAIMLDPNKPSPTICKNIGTGGVWHWRKRWLSIEEILVLTGFPANYKLHGSFGKRWARVGNSVAPPMTREIVKQSLR